MPTATSNLAALVLLLNCFSVLVYGNLEGGAIGTVDFDGMKIRVFQAAGVRVAEPIVQFNDSCSNLRYNWLYLRYELSLPFHLDTDSITTAEGRSLEKLTVTNVLLKINQAFARKQSQVTAVAVGGHSRWNLVFLCETFARCMGLNDELLNYPRSLEQAVRFSVVGWVANWHTKLSAQPSALHLKNCNEREWITFLRRVDDNISFKKTWDEYVKGFGNPKSNYWMGLESLFQITARRDVGEDNYGREDALCRLRIETVDTDDSKYTAEYGLFQVMDADQNYRLRVREEAYESTIESLVTYHDNQMFSTYDRDRDISPSMSCSIAYGSGGFWFGDCESMHPIVVTYDVIRLKTGRWINIKILEMKFKCG